MHIYNNIKRPVGNLKNYTTKTYADEEWVIQYNEVTENKIEIFAVLAKKRTMDRYKTYIKLFS